MKKTYVLKREVKICHDRDFISWLRKQEIDKSSIKEILQEIGTKSKSTFPPSTSGVSLRPADALDVFNNKEALEWIEKYMNWLKSTPYVVEWWNHTSDTFDEIAWAYQLRNGFVSLLVTPQLYPGKSVKLNYYPCFDMSRYAYSLYIDNQEVFRSPTLTVGEINDVENQQFGQIAMCYDDWHILEG